MRPAPQSSSRRHGRPGLNEGQAGPGAPQPPELLFLPVFLQLDHRPVVVIGGGHIAGRKVALLRKSGALVTVVAPQLHADLQAQVDAGAIRYLRAAFTASQLDCAELVIAATADREINAAVMRAARERRIPINVVDDPQLSTFIFPAIIDRSPLIIAVSSGGEAPVLARRLREQMEGLLPARLGALARFMGERRGQVKSALLPAARRPFWERIVGGLTGSRLLSGDAAGAGRQFEGELCSATGRSQAGEVYLIGAGPGDPDLLTLRALQLLQQADVVLYDRLVPESIVERSRRDARRVLVGKQAGEGASQERINRLLVEYAQQGLRVARLKGGDPLIFGRGGEEMEVLRAHGIAYQVVPGITAALGAAAAAGIPLTHRHISQSVTFMTGHALDDPSADWTYLAGRQRTIVFYMGVAHLAGIVAKLLAAGAPGELPVALIEKATLAEQRILRASLTTIESVVAGARPAPPALLVVGAVAAFEAGDLLSSLTSPDPLSGAIA